MNKRLRRGEAQVTYGVEGRMNRILKMKNQQYEDAGGLR